MMILLFRREEVTRTPDPYVPNVVRYQLRYFSLTLFASIICWRKFSRILQKRVQKYCFFLIYANYFALFLRKVRFPGLIGSVFAIISRTCASVSVSAA